MVAFINANGFAALAFYFVTITIKGIQLGHPVFITAQHLTVANFVVLPQFSFAGGTF
jgi:hypothetical protein